MKHSDQKVHDYKAASRSFVFCRVDSQLTSKQRLEGSQGGDSAKDMIRTRKSNAK